VIYQYAGPTTILIQRQLYNQKEFPYSKSRNATDIELLAPTTRRSYLLIADIYKEKSNKDDPSGQPLVSLQSLEMVDSLERSPAWEVSRQ
jgi:hypothetical protein